MSHVLSCIPRFQLDAIRKDRRQLTHAVGHLKTKDDFIAVLTNIQEILDQDICCVL